jgi:hypothetical protein
MRNPKLKIYILLNGTIPNTNVNAMVKQIQKRLIKIAVVKAAGGFKSNKF